MRNKPNTTNTYGRYSTDTHSKRSPSAGCLWLVSKTAYMQVNDRTHVASTWWYHLCIFYSTCINSSISCWNKRAFYKKWLKIRAIQHLYYCCVHFCPGHNSRAEIWCHIILCWLHILPSFPLVTVISSYNKLLQLKCFIHSQPYGYHLLSQPGGYRANFRTITSLW